MPRGVRRGPKAEPIVLPGPLTQFSHVDPDGGVHAIIVWNSGRATSFYIDPRHADQLAAMFKRHKEGGATL